MARGNGEGSVYFERRGPDPDDGRWIAQIVLDGKKRRRMAPTAAKAKRLLREMQAEVSAGGTPGNRNVTVEQLLARWRDNALPARDLSVCTITSYEWCVDVLTEAIGSHRADRLSPEQVEQAFATLAEVGRPGRRRPFARSSLVKLRSVLGKALDYGLRRRLVTRNVARIVELPTNARRAEPGRSLTVEQARVLLDSTADHPLHALWRLMLMLGLRPGEASGLSWRDVDLQHGIIHVRRSLKLERGQLLVTESLKTSRARRSLKPDPSVIDALRRHRRRQTEERLAAGEIWSNPDDLVFTTSLGGPFDPGNLRRTFTKVTKDAGLGQWHPHELRHSTASILSAAGVPLERIADVLGHDGTRMTALVYRHAVAPTVDDAAVMGDVLGA